MPVTNLRAIPPSRREEKRGRRRCPSYFSEDYQLTKLSGCKDNQDLAAVYIGPAVRGIIPGMFESIEHKNLIINIS